MTVMSLAISLKYKLSFKNDIDTKEHEYMQKCPRVGAADASHHTQWRILNSKS